MTTAISAKWHFFANSYRAPGQSGLTGPTTKLASWQISNQEMYGIVVRSWLQTGVKIKCRTDHKNLESWVKEVGRQSALHQFLARFPLEVVYIKEEDNGAADVLSRWAYPAYLANPDTNLHGRVAD